MDGPNSRIMYRRDDGEPEPSHIIDQVGAVTRDALFGMLDGTQKATDSESLIGMVCLAYATGDDHVQTVMAVTPDEIEVAAIFASRLLESLNVPRPARLNDILSGDRDDE